MTRWRLAFTYAAVLWAIGAVVQVLTWAPRYVWVRW